MKASSVVALFGTVAVIGGGLAGAYWYGNQPIKEYYPNGALKSITEQKMFEKIGKYQLFAQDGAKVLECNQEKGIKTGPGEIFFTDGTINVNYQNDKINGPVKINSAKYGELIAGVDLRVDNSELKLSSGENIEASAAISCAEDDFVLNMREFLNVQNYNNFKNFFGCLNFNKATFTMDGGKCTYEGSYQFPRYLADSKSVCEVNNTDFLEGYAQGFNMLSDLSSSMAAAGGTVAMSAGHLNSVSNFKFETDYKIADNKFTFAATTTSENATIEQKGSFIGLDKVVDGAVEFAFSSQDENEIKNIVTNILQNMTWSDWEATINGHKRFTVKGDFNFMEGFSDPYVMSYYSNNEVTTQWKFDAKGSQLTSKYPNTNIPLFSFGMSVNDGFKKAYKALVQDALAMGMPGSATFNPMIMEKLQNEATALVKGINSFSTVLMNAKGEKTISGAVMIQKNFNLEQFMMSPMQFFNFKVVTYQNNKPLKVYEGNAVFGFKLNGKTLPPEQYGVEAEYLMNTLKDSFENVMSELEKTYSALDENKLNWIDADIDPFLFGLYQGYTTAKEQLGLFGDEESFDEDLSDEISMIVVNTKTAFMDNPDKYKDLTNESAINLGLVSMYDENKKPMNSYMGKTVFKVSKKNSEGSENDAFIVALSGIPSDACAEFLNMGIDMLPQVGFMGISVGQMGAASKGFAELDKITEDSADNAGNLDVSQGFITAKPAVLEHIQLEENAVVENILTEENINKICSDKEGGNFIAVKYY